MLLEPPQAIAPPSVTEDPAMTPAGYRHNPGHIRHATDPLDYGWVAAKLIPT